MFIKPISILAFFLLIVSCCGSKQIVSTPPTEDIVQVEQQPDVIVEQEAEIEIEETEIIETPAEIEESEIKIVEEVEAAPEIIEVETFNHDSWNSLLQKHVSDQGNVNYKGFKADKTKLYGYIEYLQNNIPQDSWSRNKTLAYWINAYNALTVDLIIRNYPLQSIKDIKDPWDQRLWKFGLKWYNLNDIEHQILRKMDEPRIHFAIVCASVSCPKLQNFAFNIRELNEQLTLATKEFLKDSSKNNISKNSLKLSKIFKWFGKDFKTNGSSLIDFLNQYSDVTISDKAKKSYKDYNWNLNE